VVRAVIADTGPIHYLVLIGHSEIFPLYSKKSSFLPLFAVSSRELKRRKPYVTGYKQRHLGCKCIHRLEPLDDPSLKGLDEGEKAALVLAVSLAGRSRAHG